MDDIVRHPSGFSFCGVSGSLLYSFFLSCSLFSLSVICMSTLSGWRAYDDQQLSDDAGRRGAARLGR